MLLSSLTRFASVSYAKSLCFFANICAAVCFPCLLNIFSPWAELLPDVNYAFIGVVITKFVISFFWLFNFAFFGMLWHPSCAFFCFLSCLLVCSLLLCMYFRACQSCCNDLMLCLIVFCQQIVHICIVCIYGGCCRCHFLDLSDFLCAHVPFYYYGRSFIFLLCCLLFCFPCYGFS